MKRDLRVQRDYPHPPELVWRALTEPALIARWLMDNDFSPEVGHRFILRTDPAPGFDGIVHCEVLDLEAPRRMRWSWRGGPIDTVVTFTLSETWTPRGTGTRLLVEHTGFQGLPAVLVSFILGSGNGNIYGKLLPALLDELASHTDAASSTLTSAPVGSCDSERGLWWWLAKAFSPILRRAPAARPAPPRD